MRKQCNSQYFYVTNFILRRLLLLTNSRKVSVQKNK